MQLGMIGLGRMGGNIVRRLMRGGHQCVVFDTSDDAVSQLAGEGARGAKSVAAPVEALAKPRAIWIMLPGGGNNAAGAGGVAPGPQRPVAAFPRRAATLRRPYTPARAL